MKSKNLARPKKNVKKRKDSYVISFFKTTIIKEDELLLYTGRTVHCPHSISQRYWNKYFKHCVKMGFVHVQRNDGFIYKVEEKDLDWIYSLPLMESEA